ncbi:MAG: hypothetical protein K0R54_4624 [Clostridiaceae bacterium]|jgi:dinuclear metal center YbgI/SA1388 family protein|nr:hypothetical protein [Clostridiaceae bacterium]
MSLKVNDIEKLFESLAPEALKESYDNVGLMVGDSHSKITSILVSLDCTLDVIDEAVSKNCNLIINHHPLLFNKPKSITNHSLIGKKIMKAVSNNINIYASHTNLDSVKGGLNDIAMEILGFKSYTILQPAFSAKAEGGIGRIVKFENPITVGSLCDRVKKALGVDVIKYSGSIDKDVNKLAVINGSGEDFFQNAIDLNVDCVITGDTTHHHVSDCLEQGVAVIDAGHFELEWCAMKVFGKRLQTILNKHGFSNSVIISEFNKSPYEYR